MGLHSCRRRQVVGRPLSFHCVLVFLTAFSSAVCTSRRTVLPLHASAVADLSTITATEVPGTFRVPGSNRRTRDLQAVFEKPPRVRIAGDSSIPT